MQVRHQLLLTGLPMLALATPALAQTAQVQLTIPRLTVAEYNRPYVAIWLEKHGAPARTLQIWYDFDMPKNEGTKWLGDVRSWWRASGRTMRFPADGVTGATRAPGKHMVRVPTGQMAPGQYVLAIEAAREVGGREVVRVPFSWPPKPGQTFTASGKSELGAVALAFTR